MQHIETVTVGSGGAASITFSAIPDTFTDLLLVVSARTTQGATYDGLKLNPNGATSNGSTRRLFGNGSAAGSNTTAYVLGASATASNATGSTFAHSFCYIPNYRSSVAKSFSIDTTTENNATEAHAWIMAGLWNDTSAITSLTIISETSSTIVEHSSASLYGILAGSDGIVAVS